MQLGPNVLEDRHVRLEPMAETHREDLRSACDADPATWTNLYPYSLAGHEFDRGWARFYAKPAADRINYAVVVEGRCMGVSSYLTIDPSNQALEIGGTYYHPAIRGAAANPASKRLMLEHAFESGARRVQFKVDAINARSRAAVLKLGASQEGILRQDRVVWTGRVRDTVVFSILADEWPAVRDGLDARLAALG
ncbi:GNAT family protein [Phenylobacterium sp.]|uniref:GNAT family N-acetyltransferase n=1 Tax=Phenylobacterium sp. TaxID=1871053 RepID=UPI00121C89B7|nr:GNAT family protein [Phenylobacterium sp.]THD53594.1 MAG: N-acetyltransferase [Phenylobacterium sp.]